MNAMQRLLRVPELAQTMQEMSREMMRAGIIEEMMDESMQSFEEVEEMENEAQAEIDKVLFELTEGKLGEAPEPPKSEEVAAANVEPAVELEDESELTEMQSRLAALKS